MATGIAVKETLTQIGHDFTVGAVVRFTGIQYEKALADTSAHAEALGVIESVSESNFTVVLCGRCVMPGTALTPGTMYFLSDVTAGLLTATEPTILGHVSKPLFLATSAISGVVVQYRGTIIQA